ncbi:ribokinase [Brucella endophytica]|uniref:Ribokinase n=1 Tax=Brucella endophytica TaxID=1963359 RepID=A0A916SFJ4_9HYPH|nr:sugar kinase [Brucella endophytica]GGA94810.1 ribokinase [Brucella endophytica]
MIPISAFPADASPAVVCLGLSALDRVWRVGTPFSGGSEKIRASDHLTEPGGMAANAAVAIARLGGRASFWGRAGDDEAGRIMSDGFVAEGVDIRNFRLFEGGASSVSGIIVDAGGERQIVNFRGRYPADASWLPLTALSADCVLADPRWPEGAEALFAEARRRGIPTVLDGDVADIEMFERLLPLTDHAIFSEPGLRGFAGDIDGKALDSAAGFGCRVVAVTRGPAGLTWRDSGGLHDLGAPRVEAIDTTAAGDVFHGAYAFGLGAHLRVADAFLFASSVAAFKCTRPGGRAAIPSLDDLKSF